MAMIASTTASMIVIRMVVVMTSKDYGVRSVTPMPVPMPKKVQIVNA